MSCEELLIVAAVVGAVAAATVGLVAAAVAVATGVDWRRAIAGNACTTYDPPFDLKRPRNRDELAVRIDEWGG